MERWKFKMRIQQINQQDRKAIDAFIERQWFSLQMVVHGESIDLSLADGWFACENDFILGLITYRIIDHEMEILSLDSIHERMGVGTALLNQAIAKAKESKCSKIKVITTNDNLYALRFYQKRGFNLVRIYRNAVDAARKLKPSIPLIGNDGIPLKHEIELEYMI